MKNKLKLTNQHILFKSAPFLQTVYIVSDKFILFATVVFSQKFLLLRKP